MFATHSNPSALMTNNSTLPILYLYETRRDETGQYLSLLITECRINFNNKTTARSSKMDIRTSPRVRADREPAGLHPGPPRVPGDADAARPERGRLHPRQRLHAAGVVRAGRARPPRRRLLLRHVRRQRRQPAARVGDPEARWGEGAQGVAVVVLM